MPAECEFELDALLGGADPLLGELAGGGPERLAGQAAEGVAAPQSERLPEEGGGLRLAVAVLRRPVAVRRLPVAQRPRLPDQVAGLEQVELGVRRLHHVALRVGGDDVGEAVHGEQPAQGGDADLQLRAGGGRRGLLVEGADQAVHADHPVDVEEQRGEHRLLPDPAEVQRPGVDERFERAENAVLDPGHG